MSGASHFTIGCTAAAAIAYVGYQNGDVAQVAMAISIPFGAMLPDIDHDKSKLGSKRLEIITWVKRIIIAICALYVINMAYLIVFKKQDPIIVLMGSLSSVAPFSVCVLIATNPVFKKKTKFFRKHRGIMHTLFPIFGLIVGAYMLKGSFISVLLTGLSIGYGSHLFADQETTMGNPILWPLTDKCVPGLPVRTGTLMEKLVMLIDCGVIVCLAYLVSRP